MPPAKAIEAAAADAMLAYCRGLGWETTKAEPLPADPWDFVKSCVWTQDEHAKALGIDYVRPLIERTSPAKAFEVSERGFDQPKPTDHPENSTVDNQDVSVGRSQAGDNSDVDDYLRSITEYVTREPALRIEKSRQMRVTWLLAALMLHRALTQAGTRIAYVTRSFEAADAYLRDRFFFIYEHIPSKYAKPRARYISGVIEVFHDAKSDIPTSQIQAIAQGAEQVRMFTFSVVWADELAFQLDQEELLTAAKPTVDGGGQIILTSSANGDQNAFYKLGHADL